MSRLRFIPFTTEWYLNRLEHPKWKVNRKAIEVLAAKDTFDAVDLLSSERNHIRECAVKILARQRGPRSVEALANKCLYDSSHWVRKAAVKALEHIGGHEATEAIANVGLSDEIEVVRKAAAYALSKLGDPRAIEMLVRIIAYSNDKHDRDPAKKALGGLNVSNKQLVQGYINVLSDDEYFAKIKKEWIHSSHIGPRPGGCLDPLIQNKVNILKCNQIRLRALTAIRNLGDAKAIPVIEKVLSNPEIDGAVQNAATVALEELRAND